MRICFSFLLLTFSLSCGGQNADSFKPLLELQPQVISVFPADGMSDYEGQSIAVTFSKPIDPASVSKNSFFVMAVPEGDFDIVAWSESQDPQIVEGKQEVSADGYEIRFIADAPFPPTTRCGIFVTPEILSTERVPLNQTPGEGPTPFFSSFYAKEVAGAQSIEPATPQLSRPSFLVLNEVFYDALGSDSDGGVFIELYGEPQKFLFGYQIVMVRGRDGSIAQTYTIPAGAKTDEEGFWVLSGLDAQNGPDCLQLLDPGGELVDALGYGSPLPAVAINGNACYEGTPAPDVPPGSSLSRSTEHTDSEDNAADWKPQLTPTPGEP